MAVYSLALSLRSLPPAAQTTTGPLLEIVNSAITKARVLEIGVYQIAASGLPLTLGPPATQGVPMPGSLVLLLPEDPASPPCKLGVTSSWATPPTAPVKAFRAEAQIPSGSAGPELVWSSLGMVIPPSGSLVLWNTVGVPQCELHIVVDL